MKSKLWKIALTIIAAVFSAAVLLTVLLFCVAEPLVKVVIESVMPLVTGVSCQAGTVSIRPFAAQLSLENVVWGNADGYVSEYSIALGSVTLKLDKSTLLNRKIVIEEIAVKDVSVNYESNFPLTSNNILAIISRLNQIVTDEQRMLAAAKKCGGGLPVAATPMQTGRFQLNKLTLQNVRIRVILDGYPAKDLFTVPLPEFGPAGTSEEGLTSLALFKETVSLPYRKAYETAMDSKLEIFSSVWANGGGEDNREDEER